MGIFLIPSPSSRVKPGLNTTAKTLPGSCGAGVLQFFKTTQEALPTISRIAAASAYETIGLPKGRNESRFLGGGSSTSATPAEDSSVAVSLCGWAVPREFTYFFKLRAN